jgi:MYXO-CTERM domain-containing protein
MGPATGGGCGCTVGGGASATTPLGLVFLAVVAVGLLRRRRRSPRRHA